MITKKNICKIYLVIYRFERERERRVINFVNSFKMIMVASEITLLKLGGLFFMAIAIYQEPANPANFNQSYKLSLDTLNSGLVLIFNKPGQYKRLDMLSVSAIVNTTGGFKSALGVAGDYSSGSDVFIKYQIFKGRITTLLATSPPIATAISGTYYEGTMIEESFFRSTSNNPHIIYSPSLIIEPDQELCVYVNNGYSGIDGARTNVTVSVTAFGRYIAVQNAELTKESYLNKQAFQI